MKSRILFAEDEPAFAIGLLDRLESEGYQVEWVKTGPAAEARALKPGFDLIVLDIMLPGKNGFDLCRDLRRDGVRTPILMLTARGEVLDRVLGLKLGADDYVQKNAEPLELMARIEAVLRRSGAAEAFSGHAAFGNVRVELASHEVIRSGRRIPLSPVESRLVEYLLHRRGQVVSREELLQNVWSFEGDTLSRTVDVHIAAVRKKIETDPRYPRFLLTVKGAGYKLI